MASESGKVANSIPTFYFSVDYSTFQCLKEATLIE